MLAEQRHNDAPALLYHRVDAPALGRWARNRVMVSVRHRQGLYGYMDIARDTARAGAHQRCGSPA
jgi:hypothetical protein